MKAIEVRDLRKSYGHLEAVRGVNFDMQRDGSRRSGDQQENPFRPESHQSPRKSG